jgi:hypothetical protein
LGIRAGVDKDPTGPKEGLVGGVQIGSGKIGLAQHHIRPIITRRAPDRLDLGLNG